MTAPVSRYCLHVIRNNGTSCAQQAPFLSLLRGMTPCHCVVHQDNGAPAPSTATRARVRGAEELSLPRSPSCSLTVRVLVDDRPPFDSAAPGAFIEWAPGWDVHGGVRGGPPSPLCLDLVALERRARSMRKSGDPMLRAVLGGGSRNGRRPRVILDATAGLGRDGLCIAAAAAGESLELMVLVERDDALAALLQVAIARADRDGGSEIPASTLARGIRRAVVIHADARDVLVALQRDRQALREANRNVTELSSASIRTPDIVYIDPMFDEVTVGLAAETAQVMRPGAAAAPRRESQYLAHIAGAARTDDTAELVRISLAVATQRVVVKRHARALPVACGRTPSASYGGDTVRYDVYFVAGV